MLIQSILFFILGVAITSWLMVLVAPLIWRRALHFAHKFVSTQIPLSLAEIQANQDFLCAQHAVELVRHEQKYNSLQEKHAQQKIQLSKMKEQFYQLLSHTQRITNPLQTTEETTGESNKNIIAQKTFITEMKAMHEKIALYQQRLQKTQLDEHDSALNHQILHELREETKELAATLAAQIAMQEGQNSYITALVRNSKSKNDLADRIRKKITYAKKTPSA